MPYIKQRDRDELLESRRRIETAGELNYAITTLCIDYLDLHGTISYDAINTVVGVLECAKQEFYRRVAVPYEDKKMEENGDVYW